MAPEPLGRKLLTRYLNAQRLTDAQIRALLRETAREAERFIATLPNTASGSVRAAQVRLAQEQVRMWGEIQGAIARGATNSAEAAAKLMSTFDAGYLRSIGIDMAAWERSQIATARQGVINYLSRGVNGIPLSQRVYNNAALATGKIDAIINSGIALGKSAREIAASVRVFISPSTPGGVSYAAMRLGRTELNNAFHRTAMDKYAATPWISNVAWRLSFSHPKPDECDELANESHYPNGEPGHFKPADVPPKPHPQCLCYIEPVVISDDEFIDGFLAGRFDDYLSSIVPGGAVA